MFVAPIIFEPIDRRIRILFNGQIVADSVRAMMLIEHGHHPAYYLPEDDFVAEWLTASSLTEHHPLLGTKRHWSLSADGVTAADAVHGYDGGSAGQPSLAGYRSVAWSAARWFEEDEEIFRHPRNPYARVDIVSSARRVTVTLGGRIVADTIRAMFLFETGNITRYYLPIEDIDRSILRDSPLTSYCPYKGTARYFHAVIDGIEYPDIIWTYPEPLPESERIRDLLSFYNEKVDEILVDGAPPSLRFPARI